MNELKTYINHLCTLDIVLSQYVSYLKSLRSVQISILEPKNYTRNSKN